MSAHDPTKELPPKWETVLCIHYDDERPEAEPLCETGYRGGDGVLVWHNQIHNHDELEIHAWMPLPIIPARPS